jgi:hypothetical protein
VVVLQEGLDRDREGTKAFGKQIIKEGGRDSGDSSPKAEYQEQRGLFLYSS